MMVPSPMSRVETLDNQLAMINSPDALRRLRGYQSMMQRPVIQREEGGLASMMPEDMPMEQPMNPEEAAMQGAEQGMQIAEQVPPEMQEEYAGDVAELKEAARGLAGMGRMGDTELVHMTAEELSGLHSMGQLTYNPVTGLPEAFSLGKIFKKVTSIPRAIVKGVKSVAKSKAFKVLAPIVLGIAAPYALAGMGAFGLTSVAAMSPLAFGATTALGTGLGSLLAGQKPGDALKSALISGVTAGAMRGVGNKIAGKSFMGTEQGIGKVGGDLAKETAIKGTASSLGQGGGSTAYAGATTADKIAALSGKSNVIGGNILTSGSGSAAQNPFLTEAIRSGSGVTMPSAASNIAQQTGSSFVKPIAEGSTKAGFFSNIGKEMSKDFLVPKDGGGINLLKTAGKFGKAIAPTQIGEMAADASAMAREQEKFLESEEDFLNSPYKDYFPDYQSYTTNYFKRLQPTQYADEQSAVNRFVASGGGRPMQTAAGGEFSGRVPGNGGGMEDNVYMPIRKGREQVGTLAVSPSEYVVDSYTMAALGGGNAEEGAKVMDKTIEQIREKAYGTPEQPNEIDGIRSLVPLQRSIA
jgi:hypothetical protein